jgi:hypothetical protein
MIQGMEVMLLFFYTILLPVCQLGIHDEGRVIYIQTINTSIKTKIYSQNNVIFREDVTGPVPYNLYVWTAFTTMILSLAVDGAPCPPDCPTACPLTF